VKKTFLFVILLAGGLFSCKKSGSGSGSYHLTATIDGKAATFNVSPVATRTNINNATYFSIGGLATTSPTGASMQIGLSSRPGGPAIKVGTYMDTTTVFNVSAIYQVSITEMYEAGSSMYQGTLGGVSKPITNHFKLVITAMDSASIKGTFAGDFYAYGSTDSAKKVVAGGDFYVKIF